MKNKSMKIILIFFIILSITIINYSYAEVIESEQFEKENNYLKSRHSFLSAFIFGKER